MTDAQPFWERPEVVEVFAARPPDRRMQTLLERADRTTRVLDLGCAGGRNIAWLIENGFDAYALDGSSAMVARSQARVSAFVGQVEAERRVKLGRMDDLSAFFSDFFDLVIALGVYHGAQNEPEWDRALSETTRVLRVGGWALVAHFSPRSDPNGRGLHRIGDEPHLFEGFDADRKLFLLEPDELDARVARFGLEPIEPTTDVFVPRDAGHHVTVNAFYQKVRMP